MAIGQYDGDDVVVKYDDGGDGTKVTGTTDGSKKRLDVDARSEFSTEGSTDHFNGSVGTGSTAVPASAGNVISEVVVKNPDSNPSSRELFVSFDGGTLFYTLKRNDFIVWSPRGNLTQIHIKGSSAGTDYEIVMNRISI